MKQQQFVMKLSLKQSFETFRYHSESVVFQSKWSGRVLVGRCVKCYNAIAY